MRTVTGTFEEHNKHWLLPSCDYPHKEFHRIFVFFTMENLLVQIIYNQDLEASFNVLRQRSCNPVSQRPSATMRNTQETLKKKVLALNPQAEKMRWYAGG